MVRRTPDTPSALLACWGWGEKKVERYGDRLLAVLRPHVEALRASGEARKVAAAKRAEEEEENEEDEPLAMRRERAATAAEARAAAAATAALPAVAAEHVKDHEAAAVAEEAQEAEEEEEAAAAAAQEAANEEEPPLPAGMPMPIDEDELSPSERPAFAALLAWKRARAKELGYNDPCIICHNRTLCELVRRLPRGVAELTRVWGMPDLDRTQTASCSLSLHADLDRRRAISCSLSLSDALLFR